MAGTSPNEERFTSATIPSIHQWQIAATRFFTPAKYLSAIIIIAAQEQKERRRASISNATKP
jgi:hypothetical protein